MWETEDRARGGKRSKKRQEEFVGNRGIWEERGKERNKKDFVGNIGIAEEREDESGKKGLCREKGDRGGKRVRKTRRNLWGT